MMENYFVVIQLPMDDRMNKELIIKGQENIWRDIVQKVNVGKAKLISKRQDTGVSEELMAHSKKTKRFATYVLLSIKLSAKDLKK